MAISDAWMAKTAHLHQIRHTTLAFTADTDLRHAPVVFKMPWLDYSGVYAPHRDDPILINPR